MIERGIFQFLGTLKLFHDTTTSFLSGDTAILMAEMYAVYFYSLHINALSPAQPSSRERYLTVNILKFAPRLKLTPNLRGVELIKQQRANSGKITPLHAHANAHGVQLRTPCRNQGARGLCPSTGHPLAPHSAPQGEPSTLLPQSRGG